MLKDCFERRLDRVGEDISSADHRQAKHDRHRGENCAELAAEQALERDSDHEPSVLMTSSTSADDASRSSLTISPSARKRMRSAIAAARASWVTITVV